MKSDSPIIKVALVTGGATRIGASISRHLHMLGFNIALHYRHSKTAADALATELNQLRAGSVSCFEAELLDTHAIEKLVKNVLTHYSKIDVLINNASSFYPSPLNEINEEQWQDLMGTNAHAPAFLCKACAPALKENQGCIINISDIAAKTGRKNYLVYSMAKAALNNLTHSLASELAPLIRVNAIAPGFILPPNQSGTEPRPESEDVDPLSISCLNYLGRPEDIAKAASFLINNTYTTGQVLNVDGGRRLINAL